MPDRGDQDGPSDVTPGTGGEVPSYYFCLDHNSVESEVGCRAEVRLGPYPTFEAASQALEAARRRTEAWDDDDDDWGSGEA